jgi:hypothetical protein
VSIRIAPVTDVCDAMTAWGEATGLHRWPTQLEAMKSCLLARLVYLGEPVRTEMCPRHQGHWSGCRFDYSPEGACDCQKVLTLEGEVVYGSNVTGWLLDGNPPVTPPEGATRD